LDDIKEEIGPDGQRMFYMAPPMVYKQPMEDTNNLDFKNYIRDAA